MTPSSGNGSHDAPAPADAAGSLRSTARAVMRGVDRAVLSTALAGEGGWPYPSLVLVALDHDATPILLISDLADHTRNIKADPRVGLLFDATAGLDEPLAGARVSLLGRAVPTREDRHRDRFLRRHPGAAAYSGFRDFSFHRVEVERAHLVAGFGRIRWLGRTDILFGGSDHMSLADREADILQHMNEDHADALTLYATALLGRTGGGWSMVGIDPEGCDLRRGAEFARLAFDRPISDAGGARRELVALADRARRREQAPPEA